MLPLMRYTKNFKVYWFEGFRVYRVWRVGFRVKGRVEVLRGLGFRV